MNTFNQHRDQQFKNRIIKHDFEFDQKAWKDMETLLDKSPRRVPKWYFHFNLFLIGVLSVCLSCFFPVILDETATQKNTEDNFIPEEKYLPATPNTEKAQEQKVIPTEKEEDKTKDKPEAKPTVPLNYAATQTIKGHRFSNQHSNAFTKTETIPYYSLQHDIVNNESPAHTIFIDKKAGQISEHLENNIAHNNNNPLTKETPTSQNMKSFPAITINNMVVLEEKYNGHEELNTEINLQKNKKLTFGAIAGTGIQMRDQTFEQPTAVAVVAGVYAHIPIKGRWAVKVEPQVQYSFPRSNSTSNSFEEDQLEEATPTQENSNQNSETFEDYATDLKQTNTLLALPVIAAYQLSPNTAIEAGLVPSYRPAKSTDQSKDLAQNNASSTTPHHAALGLAIGVEQKLSKKVAVNIRYNRNLTSPSSLKSDSSIMVSARYKF